MDASVWTTNLICLIVILRGRSWFKAWKFIGQRAPHRSLSVLLWSQIWVCVSAQLKSSTACQEAYSIDFTWLLPATQDFSAALKLLNNHRPADTVLGRTTTRLGELLEKWQLTVGKALLWQTADNAQRCLKEIVHLLIFASSSHNWSAFLRFGRFQASSLKSGSSSCLWQRGWERSTGLILRDLQNILEEGIAQQGEHHYSCQLCALW